MSYCGGARKITRRDLESSAPTTTGRNAPQSNQTNNFIDLTDDEITNCFQRSGGPTPPLPCLVNESVGKSTGRSDQPTPTPPCLVKQITNTKKTSKCTRNTKKTSKCTRKRSAANRLEQFHQIFNPASLSSRPCTTSAVPPPRKLRKIAPKPPSTSSTTSTSFTPNHTIPATLNLPFLHYLPLNQTYYIPPNQSFLPVAPPLHNQSFLPLAPPLHNQSFLPVAPPPLVTPQAHLSVVTQQSSSPSQSPSPIVIAPLSPSPIIIAPLSPLQPHNLLHNSPSSSPSP